MSFNYEDTYTDYVTPLTLPWNELHNDFIAPEQIVALGRVWPSVSHAVYASILPPEYHAQLLHLTDMTALKTEAIRRYDDIMTKVATKALVKAYLTLAQTNPSFKEAAQHVVYSGPFEQSVNAALSTIRTGDHVDAKTNVDVTSVVSPFQTNPVQIENMMFDKPVRYVYYTYFTLFGLEDSYLFATTSSVDMVARLFEKYQTRLLTARIQQATKEGLLSKLNNNLRIAKILYALPPTFGVSELYPSFLQPIIEEQLKQTLVTLKLRARLRFLRVLDMRSTYLDDDVMSDWVKQRVYNFLIVLEAVSTYLEHPVTPYLIRVLMYRMFNTCGGRLMSPTSDVLVLPPPNNWPITVNRLAKQMGPSMLSLEDLPPEGHYLLWVYASGLMSSVRVSKHIQNYTSMVPQTITTKSLARMILRVLTALHHVYIDLMRQMHIRPVTLVLVQEIFRVSKPVIPTVRYKNQLVLYNKRKPTIIPVDHELLDQVRTNVALSIPVTYNAVPNIAKLIYYVAESLHANKKQFEPTQYSMFYYFS